MYDRNEHTNKCSCTYLLFAKKKKTLEKKKLAKHHTQTINQTYLNSFVYVFISHSVHLYCSVAKKKMELIKVQLIAFFLFFSHHFWLKFMCITLSQKIHFKAFLCEIWCVHSGCKMKMLHGPVTLM